MPTTHPASATLRAAAVLAPVAVVLYTVQALTAPLPSEWRLFQFAVSVIALCSGVILVRQAEQAEQASAGVADDELRIIDLRDQVVERVEA